MAYADGSSKSTDVVGYVQCGTRPSKQGKLKIKMPPAKNPAGKKRGPANMTAEHKKALAQGREQSRHVNAYLEALESHRPKRGRRRTPESINAKLKDIEAAMPDASGIKKLELAQTKIDLKAELAAKDTVVDLTDLRKQFLAHAANYGKRKGISYAAWRQAGVSAEDLKAAGINRGVS